MFVEQYFICGLNGTEAARRAGYQGDGNTLAVIAHENLRKPKIADLIEARLQEAAMGANEVLARLAEIARFDPSEFINTENTRPFVEVKKLVAAGKGHMITELYYDASGNMRVKFKDGEWALGKIGDAQRLFANRTEVTGADGGPVTLRVVYEDDDA